MKLFIFILFVVAVFILQKFIHLNLQNKINMKKINKKNKYNNVAIGLMACLFLLNKTKKNITHIS